jgi:ABC-2 type transport system permease protein
MISLLNIIRKDFLLIIRDKVGLALLFVMPIFLVILMTLALDSTFRTEQLSNVKVYILNNDSSIVGNKIVSNLGKTNFYVTVINNNELKKAKTDVLNGEYSLLISIPENVTKKIKNVVKQEILKQIPDNNTEIDTNYIANIELLFDPTMKETFKNTVKDKLNKVISDVKTQIVFKSFTETIYKITGIKNNELLKTKIVNVSEKAFKKKKLPTSTQHNVPAWTVFGIFFIVLPLSEKIIFEKNGGAANRLKTTPVNCTMVMFSKVILYSFISLLQVSALLLIGVYLFKYLGLPTLEISGIQTIVSVFIFTFIIGLASSGYGVFVGTIAKNQQQQQFLVVYQL